MKTASVKMRTFGCGCNHEFILPSGTRILIDPWFGNDREYLDGHSLDEIEGADYILLTHGHGDHEQELGYYAKKYDSKVIAPAFTGLSLMTKHDLSFDQIIYATPGEKFIFEDVAIEIIWAKHKKLNRGLSNMLPRGTTQAEKDLSMWGSMESVDYLITTPENFKILTASGRDIHYNGIEKSKEVGVNLLIRQACTDYEPGLEKGDLADAFFGNVHYQPEDLAKLCAKYNAAMTIPFHYDTTLKVLSGKSMDTPKEELDKCQEVLDKYMDEVKAEMAKLTSNGFFFPKPWVWYEFGSYVSEA